MRRFDLVIFDCDGVLVDSVGIACRMLAEALTVEGLPITAEQARAEYAELLLADVVVRAEERLKRSLPADWLCRYHEALEDALSRELKPVAHAMMAVDQVSAVGMAVCVASQAKLDKTHLKLELTGLSDMFPEHVRFSSYSVARGKPHPDVFLHAASQMGSRPERCAVIEDSVSGVLGATAAGMTAFGYVPDGDRGLGAAGARTFTSMRDLPALLLGK